MRILFASLLLSSCTATPDLGVPGHPDPRLQPQMKFYADNILCDGTCTVPRKTLTKISFVPPEKTHLLLFNTCARQIPVWAPPEGKKVEYAYMPAFGVETKGACPLLITAVTTLGTLHRGIVDFDNVGAYDPATVGVMCNGFWFEYTGAYLCSVAAGLPVALTTSEPAVMSGDPDSDCPKPTQEGNEFRVETKKPDADKSSLCVYVVLTKSKKEFRLTVNSFTSILGTFPRGEK